MRSFRRDERGISPIVATILLIATTVIAAGVIAAYVSGMYVGTVRLAPVGSFSGNMYDSNDDAAVAEYQDENVKVTFALTEGRIRNVGHLSDGIKVVLDWPQYGWGPVTIGPTGDTGYAKGYSRDNGFTTNPVKSTYYLYYDLQIPCDAAGTFDKGSGSGILKLYVCNDNVTLADNCISGSTGEFPNFWNENQTYMGMEIQSADGAFTTSFGTVSVYPQTLG